MIFLYSFQFRHSHILILMSVKISSRYCSLPSCQYSQFSALWCCVHPLWRELWKKRRQESRYVCVLYLYVSYKLTPLFCLFYTTPLVTCAITKFVITLVSLAALHGG